MEPPYVVKPVNEGSSVGVFIIRKGDNRPPEALGSAEWQLSSEMMVEEFVPGRELTVAVMGGKALARDRDHDRAELLRLRSQICRRRFAACRSRADSRRRSPKQAMALAERAHAALGCRGVTRTDFRYDDTEGKARLVVLEVNTQPGMTRDLAGAGTGRLCRHSYGALCRWMVEDASCDR